MSKNQKPNGSSNGLYVDMIDYYDEFIKYTEEEKLMPKNEYSLTLFGVSGAGKSTFLARLKSDLSCSEFKTNVIDRKDDQRALTDKLKHLLQEDENAAGITKSDLTITDFDVFENELNKRLVKDLENYFILVDKDTKENEKELQTQKDVLQKHLKERNDSVVALNKLASELTVINNFLKNVDKEIEIIEKKNATTKYQIETAQKEIEALEKILSVLDETLKTQFLNHVRVDLSQKGMTGGFYLENHVNIDQNLYKDRVILITRAEPDDETLRTYLGTGTIIPDNIAKIKSFSSDIVLYNNNICFRRGVKVDTSYIDTTKQLNVSVSSDVPFKFYLYYTQGLAHSGVYDKTKGHFLNAITELRAKITEYEGIINSGITGIEQLKAKDINTRQSKETLLGEELKHNMKIKECDQSITASNVLINDLIAKQMHFINNIKTNELYRHGSRIAKIFSQHKLKNDVDKVINQLDRHVSESLSKTNSFKEGILILHQN